MLLHVERTDHLIPLPLRMILTDEGVGVFRQGNVNLKRLNSIGGSPGEGLSSDSYNAQTVQKLIMNGYMNELFCIKPELLRSRTAIIDTTKLATFGILYKKMNPALAQMLFSSHVMQEYNRKNRGAQIKDLSHIDKNKLEMLFKLKKDDFELMELEIRNEVVQRILENTKLEEEDRLLQMRSLDKFVAFIDRRIWYLYYVIYQTSFKDEIRDVFAELIDHYLDRTKIATHLATMLMELIQNAEKAHFDRVILRHNMVRGASEIDGFLKKVENRKRVIDQAVKDNQFLELAWRFDSGSSVGRGHYKVEILLSNYGLISSKVEATLSEKMKTDTSEVSLSEFYSDSGEDKLGAGLGLLYLSYLEEECKAAKIHFNCNIYPEPRKERTTVKIQVIF